MNLGWGRRGEELFALTRDPPPLDISRLVLKIRGLGLKNPGLGRLAVGAVVGCVRPASSIAGCWGRFWPGLDAVSDLFAGPQRLDSSWAAFYLAAHVEVALACQG